MPAESIYEITETICLIKCISISEQRTNSSATEQHRQGGVFEFETKAGRSSVKARNLCSAHQSKSSDSSERKKVFVSIND
jgi:hypothetical protein